MRQSQLAYSLLTLVDTMFCMLTLSDHGSPLRTNPPSVCRVGEGTASCRRRNVLTSTPASACLQCVFYIIVVPVKR